MKTNRLLAGMLLMGGLFSMNGQNVASTGGLTSGGSQAGTGGGANIDSAFYGTRAGFSSTSVTFNNTFIGPYSGQNTVDGRDNSFMGFHSGLVNTAGSWNTCLGSWSGKATTTGNRNTFLGYSSGISNNTGSNNTYIGNNTGGPSSGTYNTAVGSSAGAGTGASSYNTSLGYAAGASSNGSNNVYLGRSAGQGSTGSDKLFIDNTNTPSPLIWGDFLNDLVKLNAKVGIGGVTTFPASAGGVTLTNYDLFVKGGILAEEVRVATTWADYVFEDSYALPALNEVECFIEENGHLPNVPSAKQVAEEGISVGEMAKIQQEKIEELTLYIIEQDKQLKAQQQKIETLEKQQTELNELKALVQSLIDKK